MKIIQSKQAHEMETVNRLMLSDASEVVQQLAEAGYGADIDRIQKDEFVQIALDAWDNDLNRIFLTVDVGGWWEFIKPDAGYGNTHIARFATRHLAIKFAIHLFEEPLTH